MMTNEVSKRKGKDVLRRWIEKKSDNLSRLLWRLQLKLYTFG